MKSGLDRYFFVETGCVVIWVRAFATLITDAVGPLISFIAIFQAFCIIGAGVLAGVSTSRIIFRRDLGDDRNS